MTTVLVDMDGVIVDWGEAYGRHLDRFGEDARLIARHEQQTTFDLRAGLDIKSAMLVDQAMAELDYFDMLPIEGAREKLDDMLAWNFNVFICTAPWVGNPNCVRDKLRWVREFLGPEWEKRTIITADKTIIRGNYLIDDKPKITGSKVPTWQQILFTQPYNLDVHHLPRINSWADWNLKEYV